MERAWGAFICKITCPRNVNELAGRFCRSYFTMGRVDTWYAGATFLAFWNSVVCGRWSGPMVKWLNAGISQAWRRISCIEGFRHDISWRNIGSAIFWYFSREIGDLAINRLFLAIYRVVNAGQTRYSAPSTRYSARATVPPFLGAERIWTPNQKVWGSSTYHWAKLPFDIYYATSIYILKFII